MNAPTQAAPLTTTERLFFETLSGELNSYLEPYIVSAEQVREIIKRFKEMSAEIDHLKSSGERTAIVVAHNPHISMQHPLDSDDLDQIGKYVEKEWGRKHGYWESAMALYNLCIRIGSARAEHAAKIKEMPDE